jgi:diacylglycerol kinase (ATP)
MIALVVKPSLLGSSKLNRVLAEIAHLKPFVLTGTDVKSLKEEMVNLAEVESQLIILACGGDGTFHLALNALPDLNIELALIPLGTGNDFARYLSIGKPAQAISILRDGAPITMDMGTIELADGSVTRFAGIASCGFDAQVNERANTYRGPAGTLKYLAALAMELVNLKSWELNVSADGGASRTDNFTLIAVGNTSSYGGGLKMCPTANAYDQKFEITYVENVTRRLLVRVLPKVFWGGHTKHRQVTQSSNQRIEISGDSFPVYADGEKIGYGPVAVTLQAGAMRVWQAQPSHTA